MLTKINGMIELPGYLFDPNNEDGVIVHIIGTIENVPADYTNPAINQITIDSAFIDGVEYDSQIVEDYLSFNVIDLDKCK